MKLIKKLDYNFKTPKYTKYYILVNYSPKSLTASFLSIEQVWSSKAKVYLLSISKLHVLCLITEVECPITQGVHSVQIINRCGI